MEKYFGRTKIKLGSFQKLVRGDKELSIFGLPDIISSICLLYTSDAADE